MRRLQLSLFVLFFVTAIGQQADAALLVQGSSSYTHAYLSGAGSYSYNSDLADGSDVNRAEHPSPSYPGYMEATFQRLDDGSTASFNIGLDGFRSTTQSSLQSFGYLYFTVTEEVSFQLSGNVAVDDVDGPGFLRVNTQLYHQSSPYALLGQDYLTSSGVMDPEFELGRAYSNGGYYSDSMGSSDWTSVTLLPGENYRWYYYVYHYRQGGNTSSTLDGNLTLSFTPTAESIATPEPSSLLIWGLVSGGVGVIARRRQQKAKAA